MDNIEDTRQPPDDDIHYERISEEVDDLTVLDLVVQCEDYGVSISEEQTIKTIRENLTDAKYDEFENREPDYEEPWERDIESDWKRD